MDSIYAEFGRGMKAARKTKKLSQSSVADRIGLSRTSVTNIELGRQRFPFHMLFQIAAAIGVDAKDLLPGVDPREMSTLRADLGGYGEPVRDWVTGVIAEGTKAERKERGRDG